MINGHYVMVWLALLPFVLLSLLVACSSTTHIKNKNISHELLTCITPTGESKTVGYFYSEDSTPHSIDLTFDGKTHHFEQSPASGQIYLTQTDNIETDKGLIVTAHKMGILVEAFEGNGSNKELFSCEF